MAFSVDAWGQPPVMPVQTLPTAAIAVQPMGSKPQLTPTQDIETNLSSKWAPVIVFPVFRQ